MTWVSRAPPGRRDLQCRRLRRDRLRRDARRDCSTPRSPPPQALTDKPFGVNLITMHPQLDGADRRLPGPARSAMSCWPAAFRRRGGDRAVQATAARKRDLLRARRWARQAAGAHRAPTRMVIEGMRGRRPYRPGLDQRAGAGDPAAPRRGAGVRRRRHRPRRGDPRLSRDGRVRRAARHPLRLRATESIAHPNFKRAFIRAAARDAVPSVQLDPRFPVIPVRALANDGTERFLRVQREIIDRFDARRADPEGGAARDRAFLGRRAAPRGDRRRRRARLADGRPERRHGDARATDRGDHRRAGRAGARARCPCDAAAKVGHR